MFPGRCTAGDKGARDPVRPFGWFSFAVARGDARAKAVLREVSQTMTPGEISQARKMAQACEASN
jgi:hypothetical protein